jgi:hypothetical protein
MVVHYPSRKKLAMLMTIEFYYFTEGLLSFSCGIGRKI